MNAGRIPGTLAVVLAIGAGNPVRGDFTGWHFEIGVAHVGLERFAVVDAYAQFDDPADEVLNVFNSMIGTSTGGEFHHSDVNTLDGGNGLWNVANTADIPGTLSPANDSFVLIGGAVADPSSPNSTGLDPSFDPTGGGTVATNAGWFNWNPPNEQGRVDADTLRTWVARFVISDPSVPTSLQFAANLGYRKGHGTPAQFAYDNGVGSGPSFDVAFATPACGSDIDGSGLVNGGDLAMLLGDWGNPCCGSDITQDGVVNGADVAMLLADWGTTCEPVIESISPDSVLAEGGAEVAITGRHLAAATSVSIGGSNAAIVSTSADGVVVTAPPGTPGPAAVVVTTPFGEQTLTGAFEYAATLGWATTLDYVPDPKVITDPEWRDRIIATGLPWRVRDNASQIEMLLVPPGTFMMGCSPSLQYGCGGDEFPVHEVTLTQPFYLGRYEVTQAQWTAVMGSNPSYFAGFSDSPSRPVERVSWNMVQGFEAATGLRLPTEAEREYACRAGTETAISNGSDDEGTLAEVAWYNQSAGGQSRLVGLKPANELGLHDMHGNVWEWVEDWYASDYYADGPTTNPPGPMKGTSKVRRGGSWNSPAFNCLSSKRNATAVTSQFFQTGFRAARSP